MPTTQITKEDIVYDLGKLCLLYTHSSSIQLYMIELTYANVFQVVEMEDSYCKHQKLVTSRKVELVYVLGSN